MPVKNKKNKTSQESFIDHELLSRFSSPLRFAMNNAERAAKVAGSQTLTPKFVFVGLLMDNESLAFFLLDKLSLDALETIKRLTGYSEETIRTSKKGMRQKIELPETTRNVIVDAMRIAKEGKGYYVGTEHMLLALLRSGDKELAFLTELAGAVNSLPNFVSDVLRATVTPFDLLKQVDTFIESVQKPIPQLAQEQESVLSIYTEEITAKQSVKNDNKSSKYFISYENKILSHLLRHSNRNILVVGPAGIGKSLMIENIAQRIVTGNVPLSLRNYKIFKLNFPAIVALSKFPTEVDKQVLGVMNELYGEKDTALYIDDLSQLVSSPMRGGLSMGAGIKSFLENGGLTLIATMSDDEYRIFSENNRSLVRLFNVVEVAEPSFDETQDAIMQAVVQIEKKHGVKVEKSAVDAAIRLSSQYLPERVLPEKAIEIIDLAASEMTFEHEYKYKDLGRLLSEQEKMRARKDNLITAGDFKSAEALSAESASLDKTIKKQEKEMKDALKKGTKTVTEQEIKAVIGKMTKLPVSTISDDEMSSLLNLEVDIKNKIISQEDAIKRVVSAVKRGRIGISNKKRPWASLLFLGPTGVGKTELAKVLARILFGDDEDRLIQIDMSEFMEQHSVSKLIGSPPGYVGYEQGGWLSDKLMENPYSVVLFDEIEKAHPEVLNILLQILEDGHLTDSRGNKVSFQNAIVILTSNIGAEKLTEDRIMGFYKEKASMQGTLSEGDYEEMKEKLLKELRKRLRPELLNRLDDVIIFKSLSKDDAARVLEILLKDLNTRLNDMHLGIMIDDKGKKRLLEEGFNPEYGARPLRRVVEHEIEDIIADYVLAKGLLSKLQTSTEILNLDIKYQDADKKFVVA